MTTRNTVQGISDNIGVSRDMILSETGVRLNFSAPSLAATESTTRAQVMALWSVAHAARTGGCRDC